MTHENDQTKKSWSISKKNEKTTTRTAIFIWQKKKLLNESFPRSCEVGRHIPECICA